MAENVEVVCVENPLLEEKVDQEESVHNTLESFTGFVQKRVLSSNSDRKTVCLEGTFDEKTGSAIVVLEKEPFDVDNLQLFLDSESVLKKVFSNDIYGNYEYFPRQQYNTIKTTIIHPATEHHLKKYEWQPFHFIEETADLYESVTLPYLEKEQFNIQWVYNILNHESEVERIVFEDPDPENGFILLPDLKWDTKLIENLYLVAIVHKKGLKSLRDLTGDHLSLLENILNKGCEVIEDKYQLPRSQLRVYVHYQPSYYHFHVHFTNLRYDAPGTFVGRAHLLSVVISNVKILSNYYQKAVLPFILKESSTLFARYEEIGLVKKIPEVSNEPSGGEASNQPEVTEVTNKPPNAEGCVKPSDSGEQ
ncbi:m7GpppX diphosphatase [Bacillus rossius redtenbacheri]|uniref:m7GpppX diphosphatase n=1 Tax=Bacillus rossius redtenbacheri TaxID=93214 RepID=UPI002FDE02A9